MRLTVSIEEAAEILGISRALAYSVVARQELPGLKLGRRVVIPRRALDRMLDWNRPNPQRRQRCVVTKSHYLTARCLAGCETWLHPAALHTFGSAFPCQ